MQLVLNTSSFLEDTILDIVNTKTNQNEKALEAKAAALEKLKRNKLIICASVPSAALPIGLQATSVVGSVFSSDGYATS